MTERRSPSTHNTLSRFWCDTFHQHTGSKYPFNGGKDGAAIKWLLSIYTDDEIRTYMSAFFEIEDDFIKNSGYSIGAFRGCLPKVIAHATKGRPKPDDNGHYPQCKTRHECIQRLLADARAAKTAGIS